MGRASKKRKAQDKCAAKKAARKASRLNCTIPYITEHHLLAFQSTHFADDSVPEEWFVDAETAYNFQASQDIRDEEEDGLGYYEDGVKRTLTDEQIAIFRHSEIHALQRERTLMNEEEDDRQRSDSTHRTLGNAANGSPVSTGSSLEAERLGLPPSTHLATLKEQLSPNSAPPSPRSINRRPRQEVPYSQRHKRKWEKYIEKEDAVEGSLTHRRMVRELDEHKVEKVEMDYGEDQ